MRVPNTFRVLHFDPDPAKSKAEDPSHGVTAFFIGQGLNWDLQIFASYQGHISCFFLAKVSEALRVLCHFWAIDRSHRW